MCFIFRSYKPPEWGDKNERQIDRSDASLFAAQIVLRTNERERVCKSDSIRFAQPGIMLRSIDRAIFFPHIFLHLGSHHVDIFRDALFASFYTGVEK